MAQEIITLEDLQKFPSAVIGRSKGAGPASKSLPKAMAKKFGSKKDAWHLAWHITKPPYQKCLTDPKITLLISC